MLWFVLVLVGCFGPSEEAGGVASGTTPPVQTPSGPVVASVGQGFVQESDFLLAASRSSLAASGPLDLEQRKLILEEVVTDEMMFQEAIARGLYRDPKVRKIMVSLLVRQAVYDQVRVTDFTDEEIRAYYDDHRSEFTVPEKAQVRRLFISTTDRDIDEATALINNLRRQILRDPSNFGDLAQVHSEDPYKRRGGDLGFITREGKPGIPKEVVDVAFGLVPGRLSRAFDAGGGLNLVLTLTKREALDRTFEQMKASVTRRLKNDRFQALTAEYIEQIKSRYAVDIHESALMAADVQARPRGPAPSPGDLLDGLEAAKPTLIDPTEGQP